jgi:hypothetical protein
MNKSPNPSNSNGANPPSDELRQQLWELAYDLLDDEPAAELRARIKSDPAIARLYAEVRLQTDLVASASRVEDSSLSICAGPDSQSKLGKDRDRAHMHQGSLSSRGFAGGWATNWVAIGGTVALLLLLTFGLMQPQSTTNTVAQVEYFYTSVTAPPAVEGLPQMVELQTLDVNDKGVAKELNVRLINPDGQESYRKKVQTDAAGQGAVELPGEVVQPGSRLEVIPADQPGDDSRAVTAKLKVMEEPKHTLLLLSTPFAEPGDKVGFSMLQVTENSKKSLVPPTDELMVEDPSGQDVVQPMWTADSETGVINGEFEFPRTSPADGLAVRRSRNAAADVKQKSAEGAAKKNEAEVVEKFFLDTNRAGTDPADRRETMLNRAIVMQQQRYYAAPTDEGLRKSANLSNAKPGETTAGASTRAGSGPDQRALSATFGGSEKLGARGLAPGAAAPPTAPPAPTIASGNAPSALPALPTAPSSPREPSGIALADKVNDSRAQAGGPSVPNDRAVAGKTPQDPAADGQLAKQRPLTEEVPALQPARPGLQSDEEQMAFKANGLASVRRSESFDDQARQLRFEIDGLQETYAPNKPVQLSVRVVDEQGRPVQAALGVRVWNEDAVQTMSGPLSLEDALAQEVVQKTTRGLRRKSSGPNPADLAAALPAERNVEMVVPAPFGASADAPSAEKVAQNGAQKDAARAEIRDVEKRDSAKRDAELQDQPSLAANSQPPAPSSPQSFAKAQSGVIPQGVEDQSGQVEAEMGQREPFEEQVGLTDQEQSVAVAAEIVTADNKAQVQRDYHLALETARMHRAQQWQSYGRILIWSAAGLLLVMGLLLIARQPVRTGVLIPAVGLSVVCLALGIAWFVPREPAGIPIAWNDAAEKSAAPVAVEVAPTPSAGSAPAESGESEATSGQAKEIELLKQLDDIPRSEASGQGSGGFAPPAPAFRPAGPEADAKAVASPTADFAGSGLRTNRTADANQQRSPLEADKSLAENSPPSKPETAKGAPPTALDSPVDRSAGAAGASGAGSGAISGNAIRGGGQLDAAKKMAEKPREEKRTFGRAAGLEAGRNSNLPAALFWRPLSPVDSDGKVTIEFTMPAAESEYRLLLDAIGNGRLGSQQALLLCREPK